MERIYCSKTDERTVEKNDLITITQRHLIEIKSNINIYQSYAD